MTIILAIESSTETASVALHCNGLAIFGVPGVRLLSQQVTGVQTHSQTILPMIQVLLAQAGLNLNQCDAIAFGAGPGSFTGVRTACGIAQGLAYGCDLPVVAVDTLAAVALACRHAVPAACATDILVALDARMGEVYWAQYRWPQYRWPQASSVSVQSGDELLDAGWTTIIAPRLSAPASVVPVGPVTGCGNAFAVYAHDLAGCAISGSAWSAVTPHAAQVAMLAQQLLASGMAVSARDAQPFYLRNNVALTTAQRSAKRLEAVI